MLHIILLILKIIGIILLCILGILVLAIVCALFVPVRYQVRLTREEGEGQPPFTAYVKISWLLHLLNILVRYPADVILRVRLMFITLFRLPQKDKADERPAVKAAESDKKRKKQPKEQQEEPKEETKEETKEEPKEEKDIAESRTNDDYMAFESDFMQIDDSPGQEQESETEESSDSGEKISLLSKIKGILDKIKQIVEKIKALFENIQYTIRKFCDKIKSTLDNIQYYREVMESQPFQQAFSLCKAEIGAVLKSLKPAKLEADLMVGMEDPAVTGQIFAIYGMLYPLIGQHVHVTGDFETDRTRLEGQIYIRGKIRAFTFLRAAIKIYFNKDVKKLVKLLKKEAE